MTVGNISFVSFNPKIYEFNFTVFERLTTDATAKPALPNCIKNHENLSLHTQTKKIVKTTSHIYCTLYKATVRKVGWRLIKTNKRIHSRDYLDLKLTTMTVMYAYFHHSIPRWHALPCSLAHVSLSTWAWTKDSSTKNKINAGQMITENLTCIPCAVSAIACNLARIKIGVPHRFDLHYDRSLSLHVIMNLGSYVTEL